MKRGMSGGFADNSSTQRASLQAGEMDIRHYESDASIVGNDGLSVAFFKT